MHNENKQVSVNAADAAPPGFATLVFIHLVQSEWVGKNLRGGGKRDAGFSEIDFRFR
jgi:hypothetical protein